MVANSIVMSRMIYIIQLWGGTRNYLLKSLQVLQNQAARTVTGLGWFTPQSVLLHQCGWVPQPTLSVQSEECEKA